MRRKGRRGKKSGGGEKGGAGEAGDQDGVHRGGWFRFR